MVHYPPLATLGERIVICGPSNTGKSTLAVALADRLDYPVFHLDQLRHWPDTDWEKRPDADFAALHDAAIKQHHWIIEGTYSRLLPQRVEHASGIILLGGNRWTTLYRYTWRALFQKRKRSGGLGGKESIKWPILRWVLVLEPRKRDGVRSILRNTGLPMVELGSMRELNRLYAHWGLRR